ncbi:MAG: ABC transporter ATP-binding protein [Anaerolineaceae bacterium]|nr:ABC transporter ATP-binding protein [Anaerolineaceae bacterium]
MSLLIAPDQDNGENHESNVPNNMAIRLENVTVRYKVAKEQTRTFKEYAIRRIRGRIQHNEFLALNNVTLEIYRGEVFGLVGPNGAGKTTLLRLVARVMRPTVGRVRVVGRVAPLLAMGAGFHNELTGRENVYLNGALLGFTREEMDHNFTRIVDFAELWDFIDAPLRTYSSGMVARLGFAVATDTMPEILIVDEVLSVGDSSFQEKSLARIRSFQEQGATILLVSHGMETIQSMCQRAAWLDSGEICRVGDPEEVIQSYLKHPHN